MTTLTDHAPGRCVRRGAGGPDEVAREMQIAVAVRCYAQGLVSQGKGAEIADLTRAQFMDAVGAAGVAASQETIEETRESLAREGARVGSAGS